MRDQDPRRVALMRDLLMDYHDEKTPNHGEIPAGIPPEEEDAWVEDWLMRNAAPDPLEGRYGGEFGRSEGMMVNPDTAAWDEVQGMGQYFNEMMPKAGQIAPVPDDPEQAPTRVQALARQLRRG